MKNHDNQPNEQKISAIKIKGAPRLFPATAENWLISLQNLIKMLLEPGWFNFIPGL